MNPKTKNTSPTQIDTIEIILMNASSSFLKGVASATLESTRLAIQPITVLSPVNITIPTPFPSLHKVPKKAMFLVSSGLFGWVHSAVLKSKSDSPVRLELSTFISLLSNTLKSAGILFPYSTITTSPGTNSDAAIFYCYPSLMTKVSGGMKFLKAAIIASDFAFQKYVTVPVKVFTTASTMPKYMLDGSVGVSPQAMKHNIDPTHNSNANGEVNSWSNFMYQGTFFLSDN